jgi:hypothetical protein
VVVLVVHLVTLRADLQEQEMEHLQLFKVALV